jgi:hypothetical protein
LVLPFDPQFLPSRLRGKSGAENAPSGVPIRPAVIMTAGPYRRPRLASCGRWFYQQAISGAGWELVSIQVALGRSP